MEPQAASELAIEFRELGDHITRGTDQAGALTRLVDLAVKTVPGCEWAAVPQAGPPRGDVGRQRRGGPVDRRGQTQLDEGPCLSAQRGNDDQRSGPDRRDAVAGLRQAGAGRNAGAVHPDLSAWTPISLDAEGSRSALNLYSGRAYAFAEDSVTMAALFASHAQVAMMQMHAASRNVNLEQALTASRQIGAAVGILTAVHKVTEDQTRCCARAATT